MKRKAKKAAIDQLQKNAVNDLSKIAAEIKKAIENIDFKDSNSEDDAIAAIFEDFAIETINLFKETQKIIEVIKSVIIKICQQYKRFSTIEFIKTTNSLNSFITTKQIMQLNENIDIQEFINEVLQTNFKKNSTLSNVHVLTFEEFIKLEKRTNKKNIEEQFRIGLKHFIDEVDLDTLSIGQKHQKLLEKILLEDKKIILLDQPDDDLDAITVQNQIIDRFEN